MSQLTKQHFEGIAKVLRDSRPNPHSSMSYWDVVRLFPEDKGAYDEWVGVVQRMTHYLKSTNPLFDPEKFWYATGLREG